jgi:hypothetical protein
MRNRPGDRRGQHRAPGKQPNSPTSLAKAKRSLFNVFGIKWNDLTGTRNGYFAPFAWAA